jgi:hypothetical protein
MKYSTLYSIFLFQEKESIRHLICWPNNYLDL